MILNGITHCTGAPSHPATNGAAENSVHTVKDALQRAVAPNKDVDLQLVLSRYLMDYRNTAHCTTGKSPAFLMFGRNIRTRFDLLKPKNVGKEDLELRKVVNKNQLNQRKYYKGRRVIDFDVEENVWVRDYRVLNKPIWVKIGIKNVFR